ncbi:endonuclease domain-containing protein [Streptomyces sp. NPDC057699]|uniref:endonuclease domain-containing protein n=1 Tax=Streptomyces sp. NPDC057699 TaxID=3346220 RepID=UPI003685B369
MYGTEPEDFLRMLEDQGNCCAICGAAFTSDNRPHVDHDHSCCPGKKSCGECVRGLLCNSCNNGIGRFKDSVNHLRAAVSYLESFQ